MPGETKIGASFEAPRQSENLDGSQSERPDLNLEKTEKAVEKPDETPIQKPTAPIVIPSPIASPYEERRKDIEIAMAKGLEDIYMSLDPAKRAEFKKAGEETAEKINKLLEKTKVKIGQIVNLIRKWLSLLPGVNKFFLEQEAKIRADEVMKIKKPED
jgi:hypothetical protein